MSKNNTWPEGYEHESSEDQEKRLLKTGFYRRCMHCNAFLELLAYCTPDCEKKNDELVEQSIQDELRGYEA